jgi:recombination protein RecT
MGKNQPQPANTALAVQRIEEAKHRRKVITAHLLEKRDHLAAVLPQFLSVEQVTNMLLQATLRNPELLECLPLSFVNVAFQAAELGLQPNGMEGYLIPRWNDGLGAKEVTFQASYMGLLELCFRAHVITKAQTRVFYSNEHMDVDYGTGDYIKHTPVLDAAKRGDLAGTYAFVKFLNGEHKFEIMLKPEVELIKARSKSASAGSGPWLTDYEEMAKKTVLRRLLKTCRRSRSEMSGHAPDLLRLDQALDLDNQDYENIESPENPASAIAAPTRQKQADLRKRLGEQRQRQNQLLGGETEDQ